MAAVAGARLALRPVRHRRRIWLRQDPLQAAEIGYQPADLDADQRRRRGRQLQPAAPQDARFATGVAAFAELLRGGRYNGSMSYDDVLRIATAARGEDGFGYRSEFIQLVRAARTANAIAATGQ